MLTPDGLPEPTRLLVVLDGPLNSFKRGPVRQVVIQPPLLRRTAWLPTLVVSLPLFFGATAAAGTVNVNAVVSNQTYTGPIQCSLSGPNLIQTVSAVPAQFTNLRDGQYGLACSSQSPSPGNFLRVKPAPLVSLSGTSAITLTAEYAGTAPTPVALGQADTTALPLDTSHWEYLAYSAGGTQVAILPPAPGRMEVSSEGLRAYADTYRGSDAMRYATPVNVLNKTLYLKWKPNGAGQFMAMSPYLLASDNKGWQISSSYFTTNHSYFSILVPDNAWLYSRAVVTGSSMTAYTAQGNYDDLGGSVIDRNTVPLSGNVYDVRPVFGFNDQYAGPAATLTIGESRIVTPGSPAGSGPIISAVSNAFGDSQAIAPNTWVMIKGSSLAPAGKSSIWQDSDFVNNQMPTELDGVSVTVNGKKAFVYYISASQINILTPPDAISGPVQVQVANNGATSGFVSVLELQYSPSFFVFNGGHYVTGLHADGSLIGPASLYPGLTTPAKAGETVTLYANGFGPTSTPVVSGSPSQSGVLSTMPLMTIGGVAATVQFAGLVSPGLFQINVVVPMALSSGDKAVTATYSGYSVQTGVLLSVLQADAPPPTLSTLSLSSNAVPGGASVTGRVTLSGPAPSGGVVVTLSSSGPAAVVPATVTVPAGQSSVAFTVTTSVVTASQTVTITAIYAGVTQTADLTINIQAVTLASLSLSSSSVTGGTSVIGTVRLSSPAQTGGAVVTLRTSGSGASVPSSVTVAAGLSSATFTITTSAVTSSQNVTITASFGSGSQTATLTINPTDQSPFYEKGVIVDLKLTLEGKQVSARATLIALPGGSHLGALDNSLDFSSLILLVMGFNEARFAGNTISFTSVIAAASNYGNFNSGFTLETITSGSLTLSIESARAGAAVTGNLQITTPSKKLTSVVTGTVVSIQ